MRERSARPTSSTGRRSLSTIKNAANAQSTLPLRPTRRHSLVLICSGAATLGGSLKRPRHCSAPRRKTILLPNNCWPHLNAERLSRALRLLSSLFCVCFHYLFLWVRIPILT